MTLVIDGNMEKAVKVLNEVKTVNSAKVMEENIHLLLQSGTINEVLKVLIDNNIRILEIYKDRNELEQKYIELVEGGAR